MSLSLSTRARWIAFSTTLLLSGCGARAEGESRATPGPLTVIDSGLTDAGVAILRCTGALDCPFTDQCFPRACVGGRCVDLTPVDCDDGDMCTADFCDPDSGRCSSTARTLDEDGDGFRAPLPGSSPGEPGACGTDCNDSSARAFPGGAEACDGVDNDCNGVVDDNFSYLAPTHEPLLVSGDASEAGVGGVAHNGDYFFAFFSSSDEQIQNQLVGIDVPPRIVLEPTRVAKVNSDTYAGPILWTGKLLALAWQDRRHDNFEIYFNRFDDRGNKLGPDLRVSNAPDFSLKPDLIYTGEEYVIAWADRRSRRRDFSVFAQRVSRDGVLLTNENVLLTADVPGADAPDLALGNRSLGIAFNAPVDGQQVVFRNISLDLEEQGAPVVVSRTGGTFPSVVANGDNFVVTWYEYTDAPGDAIWGAVISVDGKFVVQPRRITEVAPFARTHSILPLGDRLFLVWAEFRDGSYDLYTRFVSSELSGLTPKVRVTSAPGNVVGPTAAFGADGELGILYTDYTTGRPQVFFTSMSCQL